MDNLEEKCCYCEKAKTNKNCENSHWGTENCLFVPNFKGVKLKDLLHSRLFKNWLKGFSKDLNRIDKTAKVFLCGGILKRGFTLGDIDILILSTEKSREQLDDLIDKWMSLTLTKKVRAFDHNAKTVSDLLLDFWIYDRAYFFGEITPKSRLSSDLRSGFVRMRIA